MSASWNGRVALADAAGTPGHYYVTARKETGQTAFLLGPFTQAKPGQTAHAQALGWVRACRRLVNELDYRNAPWLLYGTARLDLQGSPPVGKLNERLLPS